MNIPHIVKFGITHSKSNNPNPSFVSIGDKSLISRRDQFRLKNGRLLGDYIPFYFGPRMPMLYVIQSGYNMVTTTKPQDIVYCITNIGKIVEGGLDFIFTDGHAVDSFSSQFGPSEIEKVLEILDMKAIRAKYWNDEADLDLKRRKEAEFLILGDFPLTSILGYVVYNDDAKKKLIEFGIDQAKVHIDPNLYF